MNKYYEALELHKILKRLSEHCSNAMTKEKALSLEPSNDKELVIDEIKKTAEALELSIRYGSPVFIDFVNAAPSLERADSGASLTLKELIEIRRVLYQIRELSEWYGEIEKNGELRLSYLFDCLFPDRQLEKKLEVSIISEDEIADEASAELADIRRKIAQSGSKIRDSLDKMIRSSSVQKCLQDNVVTIRDGRYVLPVKTEHKNEISGFVHDTSSSGATLFIEPAAVVEANNEIRILKGREQDEINRIIAALSAECAAEKEKIISGMNAAAQLDLYFAKADYAADTNSSEPDITGDGSVVLNKARHPLIPKEQVVPVSFRLGEEYDSLIITGPNTGGKTVILKTVGLLTAMAMCGMFIPASDGSRISVFKDILVDIGDDQSIEHNLSTFSAHMNKVIEIVDKADFQSLVLIDELGSGTDPVEGAALAVAVIEKLREQHARVVTTTHYQELKMYALETEGVENASCKFDVKTLRPTYELVIGSPGQSNAFAISKRLGLQESIIEKAQSLISEENKSFERTIERLENARAAFENDDIAVKKLRAENQRLKDQLQSEREQLAREKESEIEKARVEARRIVEKVTRESQVLVDELMELKRQKDKSDFSEMAVRAKQRQKTGVNRLYNEANPVSETASAYVPPRPYKKGDTVTIATTGKKGILISPPDANGSCFVQVGIMKTKIAASELRLVEKEKVTYNNSSVKARGGVTKSIESRMTRRPEMELDIRGYASDEGIYEVDRFIDNAVMSGISTVTIIHGKGTGVLKNAVRAHLKKHPSVKSSRRGAFGEGEDGVTIVELK